MNPPWMNGFLSGAAAAVSVWPLETIRAQRQVSPNGTLSGCCHNIYKKQGLPGFYRGLTHGTFGIGIFYAGYFPLHDLLKSYLVCGESNNSRRFASIMPFLASYLAASAASVYVNGFYVIRTRRQTEIIKTSQRNNMTILGVIKEEGISGLSRGLGLTWMKNIELGFIAPFRDRMKNEGYSPILSSFVAKLFTTSITYPLDTARTLRRFSTNPISGQDIAIKFYHNPKSAYKGYSIYALRSIPSTVIAFAVYDWLTEDNCK